MDRDVQLGNRIIANLIMKKEKKRLQNRIKHIKSTKSEYSSSSKSAMFKNARGNQIRLNSAGYDSKNIEIERENVALFNRIASIIKPKRKKHEVIAHGTLSALNVSGSAPQISRSKDKSNFGSSCSIAKKAAKSHAIIDFENKILEKRLHSQKPTINNQLFYHERAKNEKYLKRMGKYPYILNRKTKTESDISSKTDSQFPFISKDFRHFREETERSGVLSPGTEFYRHQTLDFKIVITQIVKDSPNQQHKGGDQNQNKNSLKKEAEEGANLFQIVIQDIQTKEKHQLSMGKEEFLQRFEQYDCDYQAMIGCLRLRKDGRITFEHCGWERQSQQRPRVISSHAEAKKLTSSIGKLGSKGGELKVEKRQLQELKRND